MFTYLLTVCLLSYYLAYGLGLAATFVALILMKIGQPALLYLAPSVLIACVIVGAMRGELKALWRGRVVRYFLTNFHFRFNLFLASVSIL